MLFTPVFIRKTTCSGMMAQCGLHVAAEKARICMNNLILCDIGDGQNLSENLSTFSAHITNVLSILQKAGQESLVILDELGSGTDPAEGMGIAVAILKALKRAALCIWSPPTIRRLKPMRSGRKG